jgi:von Willebrand factor type A domain
MSQDLDLLNQSISVPDIDRGQIDYVLVDSSGSMHHMWQDAMAAVDGYVSGIQGVDTTVTMAVFSQGYGAEFDYRVERESKAAEWYSVSGVTCIGGGTPLYDAINHMCRILHEKMPTKCSIAIVTDGEDTSSKTTVEHAKSLLDWCRRRGWQVTFLGCNFENSRQAKALGADTSNALGIKAKQLVDATSALAAKRRHYDQFGSQMGFTDEEKKAFGGYLAPPPNGTTT